MGTVVTEALGAADRLETMGIPANVVCVTSPDLLFRAVQARRGHDDAPNWILDQLFPLATATPLVTVLDGHPHTFAFLAGINQVPATHLGVAQFGQSGSLPDVYKHHGLGTDTIIQTVLDLYERTPQM